MLKDSKTDMDFHTIILKTTRLSFFDKAGCTRQFESELSLRSLAPLFPIKEGSTFLTKPLFNSLYDPFGSPCRGQKRCSNRFAIWLADHQRSTPAVELRFLCGDKPAFTQGFAKSICPFRRAGCVSFCPNTIPESESSIPDLSHQAAEGGQIAVFEQGNVAGIGCLVVSLQGIEDFADFLKFLTVRRYGLEGMTGEQIDLGQL